MKQQIRLLILIFILVIFSACATLQPETPTAGSPEQRLVQLEKDLTAAKSNKVDVLAPSLYNEAQTAYSKAKGGLEKGDKLSTIDKHITQARASLEKAEEIAQVSRTILAKTNEARDKALKVGADRLGKPFMDVENQYLKLTKAIENDNLSYAQKNAPEVEAAYREVEIIAIKDSAIGTARQMIVEAEKIEFNKSAPTAYNDALKALNDADAYIDQNPYKAEEISQKAAHAEFMARRLMVIGYSTEKYRGMTPEAFAIYLETLLDRMSKTINSGDLRDKNVEVQVSTMTRAVESMVRENQSLERDNKNYQDQIADLEQQIAGLKGYSQEQELAKKKLAAERAFNEQFNKVQRFFSPDEAEVYKQGGQLVIRLRGIKFPVGQAILTPENYTLLSKVQKAIQTFGQPKVTLEGHTDSTGSAQKNQELSQQRAEAVKTYLVANKTLPENRIRATGYGPDRPLAPNTTPEGRAINRRIDVLITPYQTP